MFQKKINNQLHCFFNLFRFWELKMVLKKRKFSVLDLGCGDGIFIQIVNSRKGIAVGVDKKNQQNTSIIKSKIEKFFITKKFDAVTLYHVIEHLNKPEKGLKIAKKHLKPNGLVVIETPLIGNLTEKILGKDYFAYHDPTHKNLMNKEELFSLLDRSNLKIIHQGVTCLEFPITLITTSFKQDFMKGILSLFLFFPVKLINYFKKEPNIIRVYCKSIKGSTLTNSLPQTVS